jgi:hydrogenase nickel incorporation protein HypA/HybF
MHELPITENLLKLVLEHAGRAGAGRVTDVHLVIGALSSVMGESVQFYWDILTEGTPASSSRLHFRRVPTTFACKECQHTFEPARDDFICPACSSVMVRVVAGDDLRLEAIDVEPSEATCSKPGEIHP